MIGSWVERGEMGLSFFGALLKLLMAFGLTIIYWRFSSLNFELLKGYEAFIVP
jgi:hypothetical protein